VHQGEGNRDELVIRGVDSSANFFINGFRDDVQIFRDLYNTQSIEILKGPSMLTFGRGSGGGLLNRTLKDADGQRIYEATMQTGSYMDRRVSLDAGQAVNANVAARLNVFYEGSDTFRNYGFLERYGINPTMTFVPNDTTKIKLSYEYYHDNRTADRGNPSFGTGTLGNPTGPFAPGGDLTKFFGSPTLNRALADVNTGMAFIEHDFENGLTVRTARSSPTIRSSTRMSSRAARSVPRPASSISRPTTTRPTGRTSSTRPTSSTKEPPGRYFTRLGSAPSSAISPASTFATPASFRTATLQLPDNAFSPTYFGPVNFIHHSAAVNADGSAADSNSVYTANIQSAYVRDTIDVTRWLQLIAGLRFDRFDLSALDQNTNINRQHIDNLLSPQAAVVIKPRDNLSFYGVYAISYLPASGDQFSALAPGTAILDSQKFENKENRRQMAATAAFDLHRGGLPDRPHRHSTE